MADRAIAHAMETAGRAVTPTDRSGTVTAGGTAQVLAAANGNRTGFWVQNNSAGDLWISSVGDAAAAPPSLRITAGSLYESPMHGAPVAAISVFGAATGQAFSAREW